MEQRAGLVGKQSPALGSVSRFVLLWGSLLAVALLATRLSLQLFL